MGISHSPKIHILFRHTITQVDFFEGIADLVEDFIEKSHQIGKKLDHLAACMSCQTFHQQELLKIRHKWLLSDPSVEVQIARVNKNSKRRIQQTETTTRKKKREIIKQEKEFIRERILLQNTS